MARNTGITQAGRKNPVLPAFYLFFQRADASLLILLNSTDLVHPPFMASALKRSAKKGVYNIQGQAGAYHPFAQAKNVGVVMGARHPGSIWIAAKRCANPSDLIGSHGHACASAANKYPHGRIFFFLHTCTNLNGNLRIINTVRAKSPAVSKCRSLIGQMPDNLAL